MPQQHLIWSLGLVAGIGALMAGACDHGPSPHPSPITSVPPQASAPAPPQTWDVTGTVLDSFDSPVPGAEVAIRHRTAPATRLVTDAQGGFSATLTQPPEYVVVSKEGYEPATHITSTYPRTLRLHKILILMAGDSARLSVNPDDAFCGFAEEFNCRRVHIRAPSAGILVAEITDAAPTVIFTLSMGALRWPYPSSTRAAAPVAAGEQQFVDILRFWNDRLGPQSLTLHTSMEPQ